MRQTLTKEDIIKVKNIMDAQPIQQNKNFFTIEEFIIELQTNKILIEPINSFDLIEIGIRCAKSYYTIYSEKADKVDKQIQGKNKTIILKVNQYPYLFRNRMLQVIDKYLWQRRKKKLITAFQYRHGKQNKTK